MTLKKRPAILSLAPREDSEHSHRSLSPIRGEAEDALADLAGLTLDEFRDAFVTLNLLPRQRAEIGTHEWFEAAHSLSALRVWLHERPIVALGKAADIMGAPKLVAVWQRWKILTLPVTTFIVSRVPYPTTDDPFWSDDDRVHGVTLFLGMLARGVLVEPAAQIPTEKPT